MARRPSAVTSKQSDASSRKSSNAKDWSYARSIQTCAELPIASNFYSFRHYSGLSDFLNEPEQGYDSDELWRRVNPWDAGGSEPLAAFHTYSSDGSLRKKCATSWSELQSCLCKPHTSNNTGTIVFLRGNQTRDWLIAVGERYKIDHEFWLRHLNHDIGMLKGDVYTDSALPSNNTNMLHMRMTTLGEKPESMRPRGRSRHEMLSTLREEADVSMRNYVEVLSKRKAALRHGESIVRQFVLHDLNLFSIEQDISLWTGRDAQSSGWVVVFWLDFGRNLRQVGTAPWQSDSTGNTAPVECKPTVQYRPGIVLDRKVSRNKTNDLRKASNPIKTPNVGVGGTPDNGGSMAQTACLLHEECGGLLDGGVASRDPYYACSDVFRLVAAAEAQFLEMAQAVLAREMAASRGDGAAMQKPLIMWSLLYNRQALMRHVDNIRSVLEFMEVVNELDCWNPAASGGGREGAAGAMAKLLIRDYRSLLRRVEALAEEYQTAMSTLMNAATIDESQRAISQAEGVTRLTALAFFFVPLTFTTSVFGMNFQEISDGNRLSIWVWGVVAFGSLVFSVACQRWFAWRMRGDRVDWAKMREALRRGSTKD